MKDINLIKNKKIIQGGMGVGVSGHKLARKVSSNGQLGVISATAPDLLLLHGLQNGDPSGELRDALSYFPNQDIAQKIIKNYFIEGGKPSNLRYLGSPFPSFEKISDSEIIQKNKDRENHLVAGAFVEVYLAKKGHNNPIGANFLNKIEWTQLPTLYGAMLAGIDIVLIGAGFPKDIPQVLSDFENGNIGKTNISVVSKQNKDYKIIFDPKQITNKQLSKPLFLGIVSNHLGTKGLTQVDGYILEGPIAGGHNPPPRNKELTENGEVQFGPKDDINFELLSSQLRKNGGHQPYWLAGNYASRLSEALALGASGIQVGTPFAFCQDSNITPQIKEKCLEEIMNNVQVITNPRSSPTGFPFKELLLPNSIGIKETYEQRQRLCDQGYLIHLYENENNEIISLCPAEPENSFIKKGGKIEETVGRKCLCNGLLSTIGIGMPSEKPLITSSGDLSTVKDLVKKHGTKYYAEDVINYILEKNN